MEDFEFVSPTHFVFGRGVEEQVGAKLAERAAPSCTSAGRAR